MYRKKERKKERKNIKTNIDYYSGKCERMRDHLFL